MKAGGMTMFGGVTRFDRKKIGDALVGTAERLCAFRWIFGRRLLRLFAVVSTVYGFWVVFSMDEYLPWRVRLVKGVMWTMIGHFGLWLAMFEWRSRWRYAVALLLLPSLIGLPILWANGHPVVPITVFCWIGWEVCRLVKGPYDGA